MPVPVEPAEGCEPLTSFLSSVAHEVQTPLMTMVGFSTTMLSHWDALDDDRKQAYLALIVKNGQRLEETLELFIQIARIQSGSATPSRDVVSLQETVEGAAAGFQGIDVRHGLPADQRVTTDERQLRLMLRNLLSNAVKYGAPPIDVRTRIDEGDAMIEVRDHGAGIPPEFRSQMFDRFKRSEAHAASAIPGIGLGLAIVSDLARLNSIHVTYEDADPGARFVMRVPVS